MAKCGPNAKYKVIKKSGTTKSCHRTKKAAKKSRAKGQRVVKIGRKNRK